MTIWRRFVRFLAREELAAAEGATTAANHAAYNAAYQIELREKMAYAQGEVAGQAAMLSQIADQVLERTGGCPDFVTEEDLKRARKGLLH